MQDKLDRTRFSEAGQGGFLQCHTARKITNFSALKSRSALCCHSPRTARIRREVVIFPGGVVVQLTHMAILAYIKHVVSDSVQPDRHTQNDQGSLSRSEV